METVDVAVVGAGPAGLFAAITAAEGGGRVLLLEKKRKPGLKLLASGSGRCNLTRRQAPEAFFGHYGGKERFVRPCLMEFPPAALESFFARRGVPLKEMNGGKLFPVSERSRDVLEALLSELALRGGELRTEMPVSRILREGGGFVLEIPGGEVAAGRVILAAGGCSYPRTGSDGEGFRLARELGHGVVPPRPALTGVDIRDYPFADLAGISLPAGLEILREGRKLRRTSGDLLFTHQGFSGPVILDSSRWMAAGDTLLLDFTGIGPEALQGEILREADVSGRTQVKNCLQGLGLPERLAASLMERAGLPRELRLSELGKKPRNLLVSLAAAFPGEIACPGGWNTAMVTAGGAALEEVNPRTMESRLVPGLFLAGEVLDVDGDTGGYNLQFAFSSGYLAGRNAGKDL